MVIYVLLSILMGVALLLAVPVELEFSFQNGETHCNYVSLNWLSGIVRIPLTGRADRKPKEQPARKKKKRGRKRKSLSLARNVGFRRRLFVFVRRVVRAIRIKVLDVQVRIGLDDPADTGRLWGLVGPLSSLLAGIRQASIRIEPDFAAEVFSLHSCGRIRVIPLEVVVHGLCFLLSPQVIRAIAFRP